MPGDQFRLQIFPSRPSKVSSELRGRSFLRLPNPFGNLAGPANEPSTRDWP